jgi:TRAP-type mannitol/chloroaromatic compound transport system permease small subunit
MNYLLGLSRQIDRLNQHTGRLANIMILLSCLISAGNALLRYGFNLSDNWPLELQWYMFAIAVMFGASYVPAQ